MDLRERKRDLVRQSIVESAYALFVERGFDATTVEMVASRAGVSARTVYRYFESKESIVFGELTGMSDQLADAVHVECSDGVDMPKLVAAFATWLGRQAFEPRFSTLCALMRDNAALMGWADAWRRDLSQRIAAEIAAVEGVDEPRLADHARAGAVVAVSAAAISAWVVNGCRQDLAVLVREAGGALTASTVSPSVSGE